jgi:hypothetical protein
VDRRCLLNYTQATEEVCSLICFSCACVFPFVPSRKANEIGWAQPLAENVDSRGVQGHAFLGMSLDRASELLGLDAYLARYGNLPGCPDLRQHMSEFEDWQMKIHSGGKTWSLLCCPEDKRCTNRTAAHEQILCVDCELPLCEDCREKLQRKHPEMPAACLANDMMVFYAPREVYEEKVTVMEMICASICITSMICFSLECRYGNMLDSECNMQTGRVAARGNATSFPLPWRNLLSQLQLTERLHGASAVSLPRTGAELSEFVHILLKSNDMDKPEDWRHFIHQARVRRRVVALLIQNAKSRQQRGYVDVDEAEMIKKAADLPEDDVPPEIIRLLPYDQGLEKVQIQKVRA